MKSLARECPSRDSVRTLALRGFEFYVTCAILPLVYWVRRPKCTVLEVTQMRYELNVHACRLKLQAKGRARPVNVNKLG